MNNGVKLEVTEEYKNILDRLNSLKQEECKDASQKYDDFEHYEEEFNQEEVKNTQAFQQME